MRTINLFEIPRMLPSATDTTRNPNGFHYNNNLDGDISPSVSMNIYDNSSLKFWQKCEDTELNSLREILCFIIKSALFRIWKEPHFSK